MRGKLTKRRHTLLGMLVFIMLAACLSGCSLLQAEAASPEAAPGETSSTETAPPTNAEAQPPTDHVLPPTPSPTDKENNEHRKLIALTFDDGPDSKYTTQILDILAENDVKATFFVVGTQVGKYPEVAKRIVEEGHSIGNHSWSHSDLTKLSEKARNKEIDRTQQAIIEATGNTPHLLRAPYGAISKTVLNSIHGYDMKHVYWTVDTRDWAGTPVDEMHRNVMTNAGKGGIVLMHSFGGRKHAIEHTVKLLPSIIKDLKAKGYELVTVDELIASGQYSQSVIK
ncbi:polysaccharide deacetylase family protein [Cohnella herbarum]|nr:polysaccharide deacetylase family protein [Cohnella herbarum]